MNQVTIDELFSTPMGGGLASWLQGNILPANQSVEQPFEKFPKIARLNRDIIITEKIDGINAQIYIEEDGEVIHFGSRTRWLKPGEVDGDPHGFAFWGNINREELLKLGPGRHFGEWWGRGIGRAYNRTDRQFTLFNTTRWTGNLPTDVVSVAPVLYYGAWSQAAIDSTLWRLEAAGSQVAPGFNKPEGIVIFHTQAHTMFKVTLKNDHRPKGGSK